MLGLTWPTMHRRTLLQLLHQAIRREEGLPSVLGPSHFPMENSLVFAWLYDWAWGFLRTPALQQYAAVSVRSGFSNLLMTKLAALGANGAYPGNMHGQLMSWIRKVWHRTQTEPSTQFPRGLIWVDVEVGRAPSCH